MSSIKKNFKIVNGLEVNNYLIFADTDSNKVGIATTTVNYTLDVNGTIGAKSAVLSGITTVSDIYLSGRVAAGSSSGISGQYLVSTGAGVTWVTVPQVRVVDTQTASPGQILFNTLYAVGLLDVYVNGVRLTTEEFIANDGATVTLTASCFGDETVEFISYSALSVSAGTTGISGVTVLNNGVPIGNPLKMYYLNLCYY